MFSIIRSETAREILIETVENRLSYRSVDDDQWGLRQKPVSDLESAVEKLQTVALSVPLAEMHYLGLEEHPEQPDDVAY